jgi:DNA-binding NtrC family response regulator
MAAMEKLLIRDALRRTQGNRAAAARELGIDVSTLFRKLKALGIREGVRKAPPTASIRPAKTVHQS